MPTPTESMGFIPDNKSHNKEINSYEIFADGFSVIKQNDTLSGAISMFSRENLHEPIAAINVNHPIYKELICEQTASLRSEVERLKDNYESLNKSYDYLGKKYAELEKLHSDLLAAFNNLSDENEKQQKEIERLKGLIERLSIEGLENI